jgi:hypothetical protein
MGFSLPRPFVTTKHRLGAATSLSVVTRRGVLFGPVVGGLVVALPARSPGGDG